MMMMMVMMMVMMVTMMVMMMVMTSMRMTMVTMVMSIMTYDHCYSRKYLYFPATNICKYLYLSCNKYLSNICQYLVPGGRAGGTPHWKTSPSGFPEVTLHCITLCGHIVLHYIVWWLGHIGWSHCWVTLHCIALFGQNRA